MPYRFQNVLRTYLHFENYYARVAEMLHLLPRRKLEYRIRKGPRFLVRPYTTDAACVVGVTREAEYFTYFGIFPGDIVIDIGANIGSFSVFAAWSQPTARVIAVEPLRDNFSLLSENVARNGLSNVELRHCGIMAQAGEITVYHGKNEAEGSSSIIAVDGVDASRAEVVPCIAFSDLMDSVPRCDFLKIDCEGAEFDFLLPAPSATLRKIRKLAMEYHDYRPDVSHLDLVRRLKDEGFRVVTVKNDQDPLIGMIFAIQESEPAG